MRQDLNEVLERLKGLECWGAYMLPDSAALHLALGHRIPDTSKGAKRLPPEDRYNPEYALWVVCPWRISTVRQVVTVWQDYTDGFESPMAKGVQSLYGRRIEAIRTTGPAWDLSVRFEGGFFLRVFAVTSPLREEQDAWSVFHHEEGHLLSVGPMGMWTTVKDRVSNLWEKDEGYS